MRAFLRSLWKWVKETGWAPVVFVVVSGLLGCWAAKEGTTGTAYPTFLTCTATGLTAFIDRIHPKWETRARIGALCLAGVAGFLAFVNWRNSPAVAAGSLSVAVSLGVWWYISK